MNYTLLNTFLAVGTFYYVYQLLDDWFSIRWKISDFIGSIKDKITDIKNKKVAKDLMKKGIEDKVGKKVKKVHKATKKASVSAKKVNKALEVFKDDKTQNKPTTNYKKEQPKNSVEQKVKKTNNNSKREISTVSERLTIPDTTKTKKKNKLSSEHQMPLLHAIEEAGGLN